MERKGHLDGTTDSEADKWWNDSSHDKFDFDETGSTSTPKTYVSPKEQSVVNQLKKANVTQYDMLKYDELDDWENDHLFSAGGNDVKDSKSSKHKNLLTIPLKADLKDKKLSIFETVQHILLGMEYTLEQFKRKEEKLQLLNEAVKTHDGNTILTVVLFLKNTLKTSIFNREIRRYPSALNTYMSYLQKAQKKDELADLYLLLSMPEEAAISHYETALNVFTPDRKVSCIENSLRTHFQSEIVPRFYVDSVTEHRNLLKDELQLKANLRSHDPSRSASVLFTKLTGRKRIADSSVLYLLLFHLFSEQVQQASQTFSSTIKNHYKLSEKQFLWCRLRTLATSGQWHQLSEQFLQKKWFGLKIPRVIPTEKIIDVLSSKNAPLEVMHKFIAALENQDLKLTVAKKYQCHAVVFEILNKRKDKEALDEYKRTIQQSIGT